MDQKRPKGHQSCARGWPRRPQARGRALPPGRALRACGPLGHLLDLIPMPSTPIYLVTSKKKPRSGVLPPQASVATKNQLGARSGTLPEGETITGGHLHHPGGLHDEEGVVHPRGWGYVPVAMCLISLSRVLEMARSWCTASFINIDESYGVFPSLSSCDELSFSFEVFLSDWIFKDLRTLDVCLAMGYPWWQWDVLLIHLMYVLVINLRVPWPWESMHRGWHTFSSWLSGRNFGALFEVLCVGLNMMNLKLCDAYRIIKPMGTCGDIGVSRWH